MKNICFLDTVSAAKSIGSHAINKSFKHFNQDKSWKSCCPMCNGEQYIKSESFLL